MKVYFWFQFFALYFAVSANGAAISYYKGQVFSKAEGLSACELQAGTSKARLELTGVEIVGFGCRNIYKGDEITGYQVDIEYVSDDLEKIERFEFKLASQEACRDHLSGTLENLNTANHGMIDGFCVASHQSSTLTIDYFQKKNVKSYHPERMMQLPSFATEAACQSFLAEFEAGASIKGMIPIISVCRNSSADIFYPDSVLAVVTGGTIKIFSERKFSEMSNCNSALGELTLAFEEAQFPVLTGYCKEVNRHFQIILMYMDSFISPRLSIFHGDSWRTATECEDSRLKMVRYLAIENKILSSYCQQNMFGSYSAAIMYVQKD